MVTLGSPLTLARGPAWASRLALAPMTNQQSNADGTLSDDELAWLERRSQGGFGLVMTCAAHVSRNGQGWPGELGVWSDIHILGLRVLAEALRAGGARSSLQLHHGGLRADPTITDELVAPWNDPATGARSLHTSQVRELVDDFVRAAQRAEVAGFDGVEVHGAHGYLIAQFLDAEHNRRNDEYGGGLTGRSRFLREILVGIRENTGSEFQVGLRLSPERWGITLQDAKSLAQEMMGSGLIDYLDMSLWDVFKVPDESVAVDRRPLLAHFVDLPRGSTRLGVAGKVLSAADAAACLGHGADFVMIGTGAILHHNFASHAISNPLFEAVRPPVSAEYLFGESVSSTFVDYLSGTRKGFVEQTR